MISEGYDGFFLTSLCSFDTYRHNFTDNVEKSLIMLYWLFLGKVSVIIGKKKGNPYHDKHDFHIFSLHTFTGKDDCAG